MPKTDNIAYTPYTMVVSVYCKYCRSSIFRDHVIIANSNTREFTYTVTNSEVNVIW